MKTKFSIEEVFNVSSEKLYNAWLSSAEHTAMTGGEAECSDKVGDSFTAWDGYISGKNLELIPNSKIVQSWRTTEFDDLDEDSKLVIEFQVVPNGTRIIINHSNIPEGQSDYNKGWIEHYFQPMKEYFK